MTADIVIRGGTLVDGTGAPCRLSDIAISMASSATSGRGWRGSGCSRPTATSSRRASSTSTPTTTPRSSGTRRSPRRAGTASPRWSPATAASRSRPSGPSTASSSSARCSTSRTWPPTRSSRVSRGPTSRPSRSTSTRSSSAGTLLNYACYVGHTAVRLYVMGEAGYEKAATDDDVRGMQRVIAEAMDAGAAGFATSASPTHNGDKGRPVPSRIADLDEVRSLVAPLRDAAQGRRRAPSRREGHARRRVRRPTRRRASRHVDRAAHGEGLPVARADHGGQHRRPRRGLRGLAAGFVPSADVPDEPAGAVHVQHAARVPGADGPSCRPSASPRTAIPSGAPVRGTSSRVGRPASARCR